MFGCLFDLTYAFVYRKQGLFIRINHHDDDCAIAQSRPAFDNIEMAESDRIEASGVDGG